MVKAGDKEERGREENGKGRRGERKGRDRVTYTKTHTEGGEDMKNIYIKTGVGVEAWSVRHVMCDSSFFRLCKDDIVSDGATPLSEWGGSAGVEANKVSSAPPGGEAQLYVTTSGWF